MPWPQRLYGSTRWRKRTREHLRRFPICQRCWNDHNHRVEPATLSHHVNEHLPGQSDLEFYFGPLLALCERCHAEHHGQPVKRAYRTDIDENGMPSDPLHPFNIASAKQEKRNK